MNDMSATMPDPLVFTESAANKVKALIEEEGNNDLKLRVFVTGGGCSGLQYGFTFDEVTNEDDTVMSKNGVAEFTPAPFIKMSTLPNLATRSAKSFCKLSLEVVSAEKNSAVPPPLAILVFRISTASV